RQGNARRLLGGIDAQDISCGTVQADMTKVARLEHVGLVLEKKPHRVGGVIALGFDLAVRDQRDVGMAVAQERNQLVTDSAGQPAAMVLLKLQRVGEPAQRIAERTDGELDQNITIPGGIIMGKNTLAAVPYFEPEADEIALTAVDLPGLQFGLEEGVVGIE